MLWYLSPLAYGQLRIWPPHVDQLKQTPSIVAAMRGQVNQQRGMVGAGAFSRGWQGDAAMDHLQDIGMVTQRLDKAMAAMERVEAATRRSAEHYSRIVQEDYWRVSALWQP